MKAASRIAVLVPEANLMNLNSTVMSEMLVRKDARAFEKRRQTPPQAYTGYTAFSIGENLKSLSHYYASSKRYLI